MGRSGGGRGGGGGRSGGRSSGGSRSGGRSGSSSSRNSSHQFHFEGLNYTFFGRQHRYTGRAISVGCSTAIVVIAVLLVFASYLISSYSGSGFMVTPSSIKREPLPRSMMRVNPSSHVKDEGNFIRSKSIVENGIKDFYNATGVMPFLYVTDSITVYEMMNTGNSGIASAEQIAALDAKFKDWYDSIFSTGGTVDQTHILFVFAEANNGYEMDMWIGDAAGSIMDGEAQDILYDYVQLYYNQNLDYDVLFNKAFSETGKRIMSVSKPLWFWPVIGFVVFIILLVAFYWWKAIKRQKNTEAEQAVKVLNTPIEQLGISSTGLEGKYED